LRALMEVGLETLAEQPARHLDQWSRRRVLVARALASGPEALVAHDVDAGLSLSDAADVLGVLRTVTRARRLPALVSVTDPTLVQMFADRVVALERGRLVFDGPPGLASAVAQIG